MRRLRLNLNRLRARQLAILAQKKNFTRREFIGLTGTAALGVASQAKNLGLRLPGSSDCYFCDSSVANLLVGWKNRKIASLTRFFRFLP